MKIPGINVPPANPIILLNIIERADAKGRSASGTDARMRPVAAGMIAPPKREGTTP